MRPTAASATLCLCLASLGCDGSEAGVPQGAVDSCVSDDDCGVGLGCRAGLCAEDPGTSEYADTSGGSDPPGDADMGSADRADMTGPPVEVSQPEPAPLAPYEGVCPTFTNGAMTFNSAGRSRSMTVTLPADPTNAPVVFIYHGNGDTSANISSFFRAQTVADQLGALVIAPQSCCGMMSWPFLDVDPSEYPQVPFPIEEDPAPDLSLFDDVLSCLDEAYGIDRRRVYATGFSAGGLWATYLVLHRAQYRASAAVFSAGVGLAVRPTTPETKVPVLVGHGGPNDSFNLMILQVFFQEHAEAFYDLLTPEGHFAALCNHGTGHDMPFDGPNWLYTFLFAHEFGQVESPLKDPAQRGAFPSYCEWTR